MVNSYSIVFQEFHRAEDGILQTGWIHKKSCEECLTDKHKEYRKHQMAFSVAKNQRYPAEDRFHISKEISTSLEAPLGKESYVFL